MEAFLTDFGMVRAERTRDALYVRGFVPAAGDESGMRISRDGLNVRRHPSAQKTRKLPRFGPTLRA